MRYIPPFNVYKQIFIDDVVTLSATEGVVGCVCVCVCTVLMAGDLYDGQRARQQQEPEGGKEN